jgi:ATP-dependent DNA helicase DinG
LTEHLPPAPDAIPAVIGATPEQPPGKYDSEIERLFGAGGPLGPAVGDFRPRRSQTEMAKAIASAIASQTTLIAEAGTGTGKTFAYLVPALMWGGKPSSRPGPRTCRTSCSCAISRPCARRCRRRCRWRC